MTPLRNVRFAEVTPPTLSDRGHDHLVDAWTRQHAAEVRQIEDHPHRWNGPILLTDTVTGDNPTVLRYFVGDYAAIRTAQALSGRIDENTPTGEIGSLLDNGLSICVLVACRDGWVMTRRSARVAGGGTWQHGAAEGMELGDMTGPHPVVNATNRALREELALEAEIVHPWLLERLRLTGRSFRLYSIADLRDLSLAGIEQARRDAPDAWETDAIRVATAAEMTRIPMLRGMLTPLFDAHHLEEHLENLPVR